MEPLTASLTFSTIVGLIGQFRAERGSTSQSDYNEFLKWLNETHHHEVKAQLEANNQALAAVQTILTEQHEVLTKRLDALDSLLVSMATGFSSFRDLGFALRPQSALPEGALSILLQIESSGASKVLESDGLSGKMLRFLDAQGEIQVRDPRFVEDDLRTLVELGFLRHKLNGQGQNVYVFTRAASALAQRVNL